MLDGPFHIEILLRRQMGLRDALEGLD